MVVFSVTAPLCPLSAPCLAQLLACNAKLFPHSSTWTLLACCFMGSEVLMRVYPAFYPMTAGIGSSSPCDLEGEVA
ncbi:hypothetical protein AOLI_G00051940 [Acnodon oligacanthus]